MEKRFKYKYLSTTVNECVEKIVLIIENNNNQEIVKFICSNIDDEPLKSKRTVVYLDTSTFIPNKKEGLTYKEIETGLLKEEYHIVTTNDANISYLIKGFNDKDNNLIFTNDYFCIDVTDKLKESFSIYEEVEKLENETTFFVKISDDITKIISKKQTK